MPRDWLRLNPATPRSPSSSRICAVRFRKRRTSKDGRLCLLLAQSGRLLVRWRDGRDLPVAVVGVVRLLKPRVEEVVCLRHCLAQERRLHVENARLPVTSSRDIRVGVNSAPRTIHSRHWLRAICHAGHSRSGCYCPRRPTISRQNFSIIASVALNFGFVPSSVPESMSLTHDHHPHPLCRTRLPPAERSGFSDPACD
jgi:hypothetical protein